MEQGIGFRVILYEILRISLGDVYVIYGSFYERLLSLVRISEVKTGQGEAKQMQNFVLVGKAKTVFRLIELKAKREEAARNAGKGGPKDRK